MAARKPLYAEIVRRCCRARIATRANPMSETVGADSGRFGVPYTGGAVYSTLLRKSWKRFVCGSASIARGSPASAMTP